MRDSLRGAEATTTGQKTDPRSKMSRKPSVFSKFTNKFSQTNSSASESPEGADPDRSAYLRRREQVRRAQKTHRERRAEYLRRLEAEVADLRRKDAMQTFRIRELEALLSSNNIEFPAAPISPVKDLQLQSDGRQRLPPLPENSPTAHVEIVGAPGENQNLRVIIPDNLPPIPNVSNQAAADPQAAIDFVLSLEHPCLYHHHQPITVQYQGTDELDLGPLSHAMMLQSPIMAQAPPLPATLRKQSFLATGETWEVSAGEIQRLLYYSMQLPLPQGEITPIQAWSRISNNPAITKFALDRLRSVLVTQMKCYGFGAVVDEDTFQGALEEATKQ